MNLRGLCRWTMLVLLVAGAQLASARPFRFVKTQCIPGTPCVFREPQPQPRYFVPPELPANPDLQRVVTMQERTGPHGVFAHRWLEIEGSSGIVSVGFGPSTIPLVDAGQISLQDSRQNYEVISGVYPPPALGIYAPPPGEGRAVGKPINLSAGEADALIQKLRQKTVTFYIPVFYDCRTFVCSVKAGVEKRSSLPCYFLLKGYW